MIGMSQEKQALLDYLRSKTGGALTMTPKELAVEIRVSEKQQSKLRSEKRFPIPHRAVGRSVQYSINAIADFLLTGESEDQLTVEPSPAPAPLPPPVQLRKLRHGPQDLSQMLLLNSFVANLQEQMKNMDVLHSYFTTYIKTKTLNDRLENMLPEKVEAPARKRHVIP